MYIMRIHKGLCSEDVDTLLDITVRFNRPVRQAKIDDSNSLWVYCGTGLMWTSFACLIENMNMLTQ